MIKVWDYLKEFEKEKEEIYSALDKVFKSGRLILGESVDNFEAEFSNYCGVKFGVGVNSGTDALFLSLKALNIGNGDEVITVPNTAVPTVSAISSCGARPVFVDIEPETYLMNIEKIEAVITKKTKCILPVHLYGQCVDMEAVNKIAKKYNLKVIEDCAQAHGAVQRGKKAGSMSSTSAFSFYPTKILGGFGDGGMILTSDKDIYERLKRLRFYGMKDQYYSLEHGYNSRLDELQAEILRKKLAHLDGYIARRRLLAKQYDEKLKGTALKLPKAFSFNEHAYYIYVCRHPQRDKVVAALKEKDVFVNISYPWPVHLMPGYSFLNYKAGDFPIAEAVAGEIFSLPMYPSLSDREQDMVCGALEDIVSNLS